MDSVFVIVVNESSNLRRPVQPPFAAGMRRGSRLADAFCQPPAAGLYYISAALNARSATHLHPPCFTPAIVYNLQPAIGRQFKDQ